MAHLRRGGLTDARDALGRAEELASRIGPQEESLGFIRYYQGRLALESGDLRGAAAALARALDIQRPLLQENLGYLNYPWHLGRILRLQADVLARLGAAAAARRALTEALDHLTSAVRQSQGCRQYQRALTEAQQRSARLPP